MSWTGKICNLMQGNAGGRGGGVLHTLLYLVYNIIPGTASLAKNVDRSH